MAVTTTKVYKLCHGMTVVDGTLDQLNGIEVVDSKEIEKKKRVCIFFPQLLQERWEARHSALCLTISNVHAKCLPVKNEAHHNLNGNYEAVASVI